MSELLFILALVLPEFIYLILSLFGLKTDKLDKIRYFIAFVVSLITTIVFGYMIWVFATAQRQYSLVFQYVSADMGVLQRIYSFWANSAGSLFVWFLLLSFTQLLVEFIEINNPGSNAMAIIAGFSFAILTGLLFEQPFKTISYPDSLSFGLVPSLRSWYTSYHPFFSFSAYSLALLLYAVVVSNNEISATKMFYLQRINYLIIALLASSIVTGAFWSNEVLWGGLWTWDPVENLTLLIFLLALLPIHLRSYSKRLQLLAMSSIFPSILFATVVIRSGWLKGPHSYASTSQVLFFFILFLGSVLPILRQIRFPNEIEIDFDISNQGRQLWIIGNLLMVGIIILTTSLLMIIAVFSVDKPTTPVIFYQLVMLPLLIIPLVITIYSELIDFLSLQPNQVLGIILALVSFYLIGTFSITGWISLETIFLLTLVILPLMVIKILKPPISAQNYHLNWKRIGRMTTHVSLFLLLLSFSFTHTSTIHEDAKLKLGDTTKILGNTVTVKSISYSSDLGQGFMPWDRPYNLTWQLKAIVIINQLTINLTSGWNPTFQFYTIPATINSLFSTTQVILKFDVFSTFGLDVGGNFVLLLQIRKMLNGVLLQGVEILFPLSCYVLVYASGKGREVVEDYYN